MMEQTHRAPALTQPVRARHTWVSSGYYAGEEGDGYAWLGPSETAAGDLSTVTRGHYQGHESETSLLVPAAAYLAENRNGDYSLFSDEPLTDRFGQTWQGEGLTAAEALQRGLAALATPDA
jgi:hypothetical protein